MCVCGGGELEAGWSPSNVSEPVKIARRRPHSRILVARCASVAARLTNLAKQTRQNHTQHNRQRARAARSVQRTATHQRSTSPPRRSSPTAAAVDSRARAPRPTMLQAVRRRAAALLLLLQSSRARAAQAALLQSCGPLHSGGIQAAVEQPLGPSTSGRRQQCTLATCWAWRRAWTSPTAWRRWRRAIAAATCRHAPSCARRGWSPRPWCSSRWAQPGGGLPNRAAAARWRCAW